ncbi:MAG: TetR/AcrR family transcriptional regulator [Solirubrobacteraceae bacterium]|jgi:AcrR family transcriptional regulator
MTPTAQSQVASKEDLASIYTESDGGGRWPDVQEAALTLFSERGYHGTTMKHVAAQLGVQAPSLYNHVVSKQEILQRIMTTGMRRLTAHQEVALASSTEPAEQLRAMIEAHVQMHIRHSRSAMVGDREIGNLEEPTQREVRDERDAYERRFRAVIQRGVDAGTFTVGSVKLASFAIIEMATSVAVWFKEDGPLSPDDVAREYGEMALKIVGVRTRAGTRRKSAPSAARA